MKTFPQLWSIGLERYQPRHPDGGKHFDFVVLRAATFRQRLAASYFGPERGSKDRLGYVEIWHRFMF